MKRFFVCFAMITMFLMIGCGGGSSSDSGNCATINSGWWSPLSSDTMEWQEALDYCDGLNECGYSDWRLPNINELRTLIQNCPNSQTGGSCAVSAPDHLSLDDWSIEDCHCDNGGHYSLLEDDENVTLWSSSESDNSNIAWNVGFLTGDVGYLNKSTKLWVRCVR